MYTRPLPPRPRRRQTQAWVRLEQLLPSLESASDDIAAMVEERKNSPDKMSETAEWFIEALEVFGRTEAHKLSEEFEKEPTLEALLVAQFLRDLEVHLADIEVHKLNHELALDSRLGSIGYLLSNLVLLVREEAIPSLVPAA